MNRYALPTAGILTSAALFAVSGLLIGHHLTVLRNVREDVLPLAAQLPPLEQRLQVLNEQVELSELQAAMRSGTAEEKLRAYVLPSEPDLPRTVALFDVTRSVLSRRKVLTQMSALEFGEVRPLTLPGVDAHGALTAQSVSFTAVVRPEGMEQLLSLLNLSGLITVGDALSPADVKELFVLTESENPAGIVSVEQFLSTDLLSYLHDPVAADQRLTQAFPSEEFLTKFRSLLDTSGLAEARALLQKDLLSEIERQTLWPLPFFVLTAIETEEQPGGLIRLSITADVVSRSQD